MTESLRLYKQPPAPQSSLGRAEITPDVDLALASGLAELHYTAFVALYGGPSQYVAVSLAADEAAGGWRVHYQAKGQRRPDPKDLRWLNAFQAGLKSWSDAGFSEPLFMKSETVPAGPTSWAIGDYADVVHDAASRLGRKQRIWELRNLAAYLGDDLPDRFDPDGLSYTYQAGRSR